MKRRRHKCQNECLAEASLANLIDLAIMTRNQNPPQSRHSYRLPQPRMQHQRRTKGPIIRGYPNHRPGPYCVPRRQIPDPTQERSCINIILEKPSQIDPDRHIKMEAEDKSQRTTSPPTPQNSTPPKSKSSSHSPTPRCPTPPSKPIIPTDPWRIQYCIERERLSTPTESKPSSFLFFTSSPEKCNKESKHTLRKITSVYNQDNIFGTAPARKVHLREIKVTFHQIWNRSVISERWERQGQDFQGYLLFEEQELKIQLQRHHIPGTLFFATEAGDLNINDASVVSPDVCFRMVDAPGQEFSRCDSYDLKRTLEIEEGQIEVSFMGIDGKEINFEIEGRKQVRLPGEGMPRNWEGTNRGDLIIEFIVR